MKYFIHLLLLFNILVCNEKIMAQDSKTSIELNRDEEVGSGLYVKNNGFWLMTNTATYAQGITDNRIIKFNPNLSKQEWEVNGLKNLDFSPMYDPKYPDYIYFRHIAPPGLPFFNSKDKYYQINKTGTLRTYEEGKERDKEVDECAGVFNSMGYFGEIWTKKKSKNDMVIILHDHANFKMTKKSINFQERKDKKKFRDWLYAGSSENIVLAIRHEEDIKSYLIQVLVIDINLGKVIHNFDYEPKLKSKNNFVIPATIGNSDEKGITFHGLEAFIQNGTSRDFEDFIENGHGNFSVSKDGKALYFYSLISNEKVENSKILAQLSFFGTANGFALIKMGLDGKIIYSKETAFKEKELGGDSKNGYKGLTFHEHDNGEIQLEMVKKSSNGYLKTKTQNYSIFYDEKTGDEIDHCLKSSERKAKFAQSSTSTVKSMDELYPCFIKNEDKISKYIALKKIDGLYNIFDDGESQILSIFVKKEQTLGLMYFKE